MYSEVQELNSQNKWLICDSCLKQSKTVFRPKLHLKTSTGWRK